MSINKNNVSNMSPNMHFFIIGTFFINIAGTTFHGTFHNYVNDIFHIAADQRGFLEFPRELPGLMAMLIIAGLFFLGDNKILIIASLLTGFGLLGMGILSNTYSVMIAYMIIWSCGVHLNLSLQEPVAMAISKTKHKGHILGQINAVRSLGLVFGTIMIWYFMGQLKSSYAVIYTGAFIICIVSAAFFIFIKEQPKQKKKFEFKLILRKKYTLFYLLSATFGIRKQLFLVFAPWLLVRFYEQKPENFALLLLAASVLGIILKPYMGKLIDQFGERIVLFSDAILIFILCSCYAIIPNLNLKTIGLYLLYICYIIDELLFSLRTARTTYLYKIIKNKDDITPTISAGVSIEHAFSMTTPAFAGILWIKFDYYWVFIIAAFVAVLSGALSLFVPGNHPVNK